MGARRVMTAAPGAEFEKTAAREIGAAIVGCDGPRCAIAISGGHTSIGVFRALAKEAIAWSRVELFWCDERAVPPDDKDSNYLLAKTQLLDFIQLDPKHVHRMEGELPPDEAAKRYDALLGKLAPKGLSVAVLGIGTDGHTCSLFPGSPALDSKKRAAASVSPTGQPRITLTPAYLALAPKHIVIVGGKDKSAVIKRALAGDPALPISRVKPCRETVWVLDAAAASA